MHELGVSAHGNYLGAELLEFCILLCQSSEFRCSDKGEVGGVEEKDGPFFCGLQVRKTDFAEIRFCRFKGFEFEIGNFLSNLDATALF
jgi:hypothetical protein